MTPRYRPPTLAERGIVQIFNDRKLNLDLFKLLVRAGNDNTAIANALSEDYHERMGIEIHIAPRTIKKYRELL